MGGLRKSMPWTFWTFVIGTLALAAVPPFAGFWSKDEALAAAFETGGYEGLLVGILGTLGGLVTAFYMARVLYLVFFGEFRGHGHPHESPASMKWPLVALAVPAALVGLTNIPADALHPYGFAAWTMFDLVYFEEHPAVFIVPLALAATVLAVAGLLLGRAIYRRSPSLITDPTMRLGLLTRVLREKYYLDLLYEHVIVRFIRDRSARGAVFFNDRVLDRIVYLAGAGTVGLGRATYSGMDQRLIDGAVNGSGATMGLLGRQVRKAQSGNVQLYAGGLFVGVLVFGALFAIGT
jgi:NADH-quinone oxidoreductase subunit L